MSAQNFIIFIETTLIAAGLWVMWWHYKGKPAQRKDETDRVDEALGLVRIPSFAVDNETYDKLSYYAGMDGVIPQAYIRDMLEDLPPITEQGEKPTNEYELTVKLRVKAKDQDHAQDLAFDTTMGLVSRLSTQGFYVSPHPKFETRPVESTF